MFGSKQVQYGILENKKIVIKYLADKENLLKTDLTVESLRNLFSNKEKVVGSVLCPTGENYERFYNLSGVKSEMEFWTMMNVNLQPILLKIFNGTNLPVPKLYRNCGFSIIQSYEGTTLEHFYNHSFKIRLKLAKELITAAIKFTEGLDGFRFYLTDINPDNVVVNKELKISFIDIDNLIIVDTKAKDPPPNFNKTHKHEMIECDGCFAFIPDEICNHHLSDINIFSVCQLLLEDLHENEERGLLHSAPTEILSEFPDLTEYLSECMHCDSTLGCQNRLKSGKHLLKVFNDILSEIENIY